MFSDYLSKINPSRLWLLSLVIITSLLASCRQAGPVESATAISVTMLKTSTTIPTSQPTYTALPTLTATLTPTNTASPSPTATETPTATLEPGATQVSAADGMLQVYVPAGEYWMGSQEADRGGDADEMPSHLVLLDAYWIDRTVVTNAMFARFLNEMGNQTEGRSAWLDAGDEGVLLTERDGLWVPVPGFEDYPAVEITWFGAQAYCQWAGRRLPSEAEWERAARGTDGRIYPWGDEIDCQKAQYANCGGGLLPADSKPQGASPYGVLGLSGNTWEWVADWYAEDFYTSSPTENPQGPLEGQTRVLRGGSWEYDWKHLRAANRRNNGPAVSMHDYGFRCALSGGL